MSSMSLQDWVITMHACGFPGCAKQVCALKGHTGIWTRLNGTNVIVCKSHLKGARYAKTNDQNRRLRSRQKRAKRRA